MENHTVKPKYTVISKISESLEIVDLWGSQVIKPEDKVAYIPYLKEQGKILLKYKDIPAFQLKYPLIDKWLTVGQIGSVKTNIKESLAEGLVKDFGLTLVESYEPEICNPIFLSTDSCGEYYICILPLMEDEFVISQPQDGIPVAALSYGDLNSYMTYDMVTKYAMDLFRAKYSLF